MEERIWHKAYAEGVPRSLDYDEITLPAALKRGREVSRFSGPDNDG